VQIIWHTRTGVIEQGTKTAIAAATTFRFAGHADAVLRCARSAWRKTSGE